MTITYIALQMRGLWPVLEGDDGITFSSALPLSGSTLLIGAWAAMRDRKLGVFEIVAASPTALGKVAFLRIGSLALVASGVFLALACGALSVSILRGARGLPDIRLILDGALVAVLGACVGYVIGAIFRSRLIALLAAPTWIFSVMMVGRNWAPRPSIQWLSPVPELPRRSTVTGFLPDIFDIHLLYVVGLVAFIGGAAVLVSDGRQSATALHASIAILCGIMIVVPSSRWLVAQPDDLVMRGKDSEDWIPLRDTADRDRAPAERFPDRGAATVCADRAELEVCVFEAYGESYARMLARELSPEANLLSGLPGIPRLVRMSIIGENSCDMARSELLIAETRYAEPASGLISEAPFCGQESDAAEAVSLWVHFSLGRVEPKDALARLRQACLGACVIANLGRYGVWDGRVVRVAFEIAQLPQRDVLAALERIWPKLRAGDIRLKDLPRQLVRHE